jgi:phosphatidylserine/phosphatidylglycerophosphate/cardiolipin synthase-like enzyme
MIIALLYITVVWFFPITDFTGGLINNFLDDVSVVVGIERNVIVPLPESEGEAISIIIGDDAKGAEAVSRYYAVYFSKLFDGNIEKAMAYEYSLDRILSSYIKKAKSEINMAMYDLDVETVSSALLFAYNNGVKVRIVTDTDNKDNLPLINLIRAGIPVKYDDKTSIMHNKFLIIDKKYVWTGSYNATARGSYYNNNNAIIVYSRKLAGYYNNEFNEMFYYGEFGAASPDYTNPLPKVYLAEERTIDNEKVTETVEIEVHFAPDIYITDQIIEEIQNSEKSIYFMAFSFTKDEISMAMINRFRRGVHVEGVFEEWQMRDYSEFSRMENAGVPVMSDFNKYNVHHKVIIIDEETVITGSANFSNSAAKRNDENILIIKNKEIAKAYLEEYRRVKETKPQS